MKVAERKKVKVESDFTTSFVVSQPPEKAYEAVLDVAAWWTGEVKGKSGKVGDEFTFHYEDIHASRQRLFEAVPGKRVVWLVTEAHLSFAKDPGEWVGTYLRFDITRKGKKTEVKFTHEGLVPGCDCFEACDEGWTFYVQKSLKKLIETGQGAVADW